MRPVCRFTMEGFSLRLDLLEAAKTRVTSIPVLINMLSKRVRQLNAGWRPYVKPEFPGEEKLDIAMREIAEGTIIAEMDFDATAQENK